MYANVYMYILYTCIYICLYNICIYIYIKDAFESKVAAVRLEGKNAIESAMLLRKMAEVLFRTPMVVKEVLGRDYNCSFLQINCSFVQMYIFARSRSFGALSCKL